jgi:hypothetical protein
MNTCSFFNLLIRPFTPIFPCNVSLPPRLLLTPCPSRSCLPNPLSCIFLSKRSLLYSTPEACFLFSKALPVSHHPPSSPFTYSPPHETDPHSRSTPYPNLPLNSHTRSNSNSNPSPTQSNPFSMPSNPSSTGSTPGSISPVLSKTKKIPYSGLEALVHVASEERRRLSSSEAIEESRARTSPTLDDVLQQFPHVHHRG